MLIPAQRKKILEVFFKDPFREVHLREIARLSKVSLTNVKNSMQLFVKNNMFRKQEFSKMTFFRPNLENESLLKIFELFELDNRKKFYNKNKMIARLLEKYKKEIVALSNNKIQLVILFGSVARESWTKESDIDILVVVSEKEQSIAKILDKAKIDVSPLIEIRSITTTINKYVEGFKNRTEFYDEIWKDRVILYNEFLFWQLARRCKEGGRYYG